MLTEKLKQMAARHTRQEWILKVKKKKLTIETPSINQSNKFLGYQIQCTDFEN